MKDVLQDLITNGVPVIDNTKDAEYYRLQRFARDKETIAKHMFIENAERGEYIFDPDTHVTRRRISFDFVYINLDALLNERNEENESATRQRIAEQVLQVVSGTA